MKTALALAAALLAGAAHAVDVYKWTDSHGVVHYGDRPASGAAAATVNVPDDPADPQAAAEARARLDRERARLATPTDTPAPAPAAARRKPAVSACEAQWQRYDASQACFDHHREYLGRGVSDQGVQACRDVKQPTCTR